MDRDTCISFYVTTTTTNNDDDDDVDDDKHENKKPKGARARRTIARPYVHPSMYANVTSITLVYSIHL